MQVFISSPHQRDIFVVIMETRTHSGGVRNLKSLILCDNTQSDINVQESGV